MKARTEDEKKDRRQCGGLSHIWEETPKEGYVANHVGSIFMLRRDIAMHHFRDAAMR